MRKDYKKGDKVIIVNLNYKNTSFLEDGRINDKSMIGRELTISHTSRYDYGCGEQQCFGFVEKVQYGGWYLASMVRRVGQGVNYEIY